MPNLENIRKQAKQYLRWHRDGHCPVAAEIRAALPRFRDMSDARILEAPFRLADAQALVARQAGFETWQALKAGASTMQTDQKPAPAGLALAATEAMLYVADFQRACDYFVARLGFEIDFTYGEPAYYGLVKRDRARLCLRHVGEPVFAGDIGEREQLLSASVTVATTAQIKALFLEFQSAGADFFQTLQKAPWGARNFIVRDPDGNLILFAGPSD